MPSDDGKGHGWYQGKGWVQKWNPGMRTQAVGTQGDRERKPWRSTGGAWVGTPSFGVNSQFAALALIKSGRVFSFEKCGALVASVAG